MTAKPCLFLVPMLLLLPIRSAPAAESPHAKLQPVAADALRWTEGFWAERFERCRRTTLPGVEAALLV